ncbi:hypothetical protein R3X25_02650 [Lutibacter sp. TH_r2]|uniref:hypothetical protein n=1 Tax=Lutibacter sp. TH_r2 TaxID=3082083 RepID=UPI002954F959|nr:hypothetical protein [Lutibacter sp. TH_r2]MDV7186168.1 hypothetical protein [Lutibacter sp. TH_r2]
MGFSKFISYFFHPINFPIVGTIVYFLFIPKHIYKSQEYTILTVIIIGSYLFPLFLLFMLKQFKMISSIQSATIEERKFPTSLMIAISLILTNWLFKNQIVDLLALFFLGFGIALSIAYLLLHVKIKISLHAIGISGLIGFLLYFSYVYRINFILIYILLFVLAGFIISARLKLRAHTAKEVFLGFFVGLLSQLATFGVFYIM